MVAGGRPIRPERNGPPPAVAKIPMNIADTFIKRPVMTTLVMTAIVLFGALAYFRLPVSELPAVDFPTISVTATLPGASPETMASSIATPLEGQFSSIAGIDSMSSVSAQGRTTITLTFDLDRDIDAAAQDIQAAIGGALRRLPTEMPVPPTYRKVNPADSPIFYISLNSDVLPLSVVNEYAETQLAQRLSTISGVAQVLVFGSQRFAVRVRVDPTRLAARGIGIDEVQQAIEQGNVNKPTGELEGVRQALAVRSNGQLETAAAFRNLTVVYRNGAPVKLEDVAEVEDSVENLKSGAWYNAKPSIILAIQRQPGSNTIGTVAAVRKELPAFEAQAAGLGQHGCALRPQRVDPGLGLGREEDAGRSRDPGDPGDLPVPAQPPGDADPQHRVADLRDRHLRRHVCARLQRRQPVAAGVDAGRRFRRRRRDRDAREHRPAHRDGQDAPGGGASGIEGDRLHDRLDDAVADRRIHPRACS